MGAREEALKAQRNLAWVLVFAAVTALLIQDLFMVWPVVSCLMHLAYRWGRLDEFQDLIKINSVKINN